MPMPDPSSGGAQGSSPNSGGFSTSDNQACSCGPSANDCDCHSLPSGTEIGVGLSEAAFASPADRFESSTEWFGTSDPGLNAASIQRIINGDPSDFANDVDGMAQLLFLSLDAEHRTRLLSIFSDENLLDIRRLQEALKKEFGIALNELAREITQLATTSHTSSSTSDVGGYLDLCRFRWFSCKDNGCEGSAQDLYGVPAACYKVLLSACLCLPKYIGYMMIVLNYVLILSLLTGGLHAGAALLRLFKALKTASRAAGATS